MSCLSKKSSALRIAKNRCRLIQAAAILLTFASSAPFAQVPPQDKSTANQSAAQIDETWQRASSKYDTQRNAILADVDRGANAGPFLPDWESLSQYKVPQWYQDAKFGIFIHWGVYAVPGYGSEWYPREMYLEGSKINKHHVETYGPLTKFGYKDFIPMFKAERWDPQSWAKLFKDSGAKYVVPVFEHHDGFSMYDSDLSDWTSKKMGPHRDIGGELSTAVRAEGLHLGASSHRIEHDFFMEGGRKLDSDVNDPAYAALYGPAHPRIGDDERPLAEDWTYMSPAYGNDWLARSAEIVQKYHPDVFFFDWWIGQPLVRPYLTKFAAYYYNESSKRGPVGVIFSKFVDMQKTSSVLDIERGQLAGILPQVWQTDTSVGNKSWGYIEDDTFKSPEFIVQQLADVVSKNGNLLLNIGPRADGTIPQPVQQILLDVGGWLKVNGEAIFGTRPWTTFGEGPTKVEAGSFHDTDAKSFTAEDFRFTTKDGLLYAIEMARPNGGEAVIHSIRAGTVGACPVRSVKLLGLDDALKFKQEPDGLHIELPANARLSYAYAYKISFEGVK